MTYKTKMTFSPAHRSNDRAGEIQIMALMKLKVVRLWYAGINQKVRRKPRL